MQSKLHQIQEIVSNITKVSILDIKSPSRKSTIVQARHLSMHFSRWYTTLSLLTIAILHGRDNHATVIHADSCITYDIRKSEKLKAIYEQIKEQVNSL